MPPHEMARMLLLESLQPFLLLEYSYQELEWINQQLPLHNTQRLHPTKHRGNISSGLATICFCAARGESGQSGNVAITEPSAVLVPSLGLYADWENRGRQLGSREQSETTVNHHCMAVYRTGLYATPERIIILQTISATPFRLSFALLYCNLLQE